MKISKICEVILTFLLFFCSVGSTLNGNNNQSSPTPWFKNVAPFQAELVTTVIMKNGQKTTETSQYYFTGSKTRTENAKSGSIMMVDFDKKVSFIYNKGNNSWLKFTQKSLPKENDLKMPEVKTQKLADTLVDGKACEVIQYTYTDPNTRTSSQTTVYNWKEKKIPLKIVGNFGGNQVETIYKNIVFTKTPENMFAPPAGAQVQDMSQYMK